MGDDEPSTPPCRTPTSSSVVVRTQQEMVDHFIPILRRCGMRVQKTGRRLARPARKGEEVLTIVNGEVVARTVAEDSCSMVIRQESADQEFYLLDQQKFAKNYHTEGMEITESGPSFEQLRQRNFKYYTRKGELLIYQVTDEDMLFLPSGKFEVTFSKTPLTLQSGDYLVTACPEMSEVWVSKHAVIYNDHGQLFQGSPPLSQEEMCNTFLSILREKGTVVHKTGKRLARPAVKGEEVHTIVNAEVMATTTVLDESSMVIRQESADHELYVLDQEKFRSNYELASDDIAESEPGFQDLKERGFKPYWRKGKVLIYEVTEQDMKMIPGGKFFGTFSAVPLPVRAGFLLVTGYPDCKEIWVSRNAAIYNDDGQLFQGRGVCTQDEMQDHFLPLMRLRGMMMRRAGRRLARPARRGEEVLTIVNNEVVAKTVVLDDSSMVIQEESVDREVYVQDREHFQESYQMPGTEIDGQGLDCDILRDRGFKYFEKTAGMFLVYKVTEEDMQFMPKGKFQVPFSIVPQPLRAGDYLVTRLPEAKVIFMSRNVEQVFLSRENLEVQFAFASPLSYSPLCIDGELEGLRTSGAVVRLTCATRENLVRLKRAWTGNSPSVLHISCHTARPAPGSPSKGATQDEEPEVASILEDFAGNSHPVTAQAFADLVIGGGPAPQLLVLLSCQSQQVATTCLSRGVKRAVCVKTNNSLLDNAARDFTLTFYGELRSHCSVERAFAIALESMRASRERGVAGEADKLLLLPEGAPEFQLGSNRGLTRSLSIEEDLAPLEPNIAVRMPFGVGEAGAMGPLMDLGSLERLSAELPLPPSRAQFIMQALAGFSNYRVLKVCGKSTGDLQDFAAHLSRFASFPGGRFFSGGVVAVTSADVVNHGVLSQQQMCDRFLPILRRKGTIVKKVGTRLARPAIKGEEVQTIINGEPVAKTLVTDETSIVIQQESVDHELYVLTREKFERNYEMPGHEIQEQGAEFDLLRERGYKYYERTGYVLIYKVTDEDMQLVPGGKFQVSFSTTPQPVRSGDYLATGYPESKEVYTSRNAEQIYLSQIVRTQEEMCRHFLPILRKRGMVVRKIGKNLARPAILGEEVLTIIDGEQVSKAIVNDDTSMLIQALSADREWYVLDEQRFASSYELPGEDITNEGPEFQVLRQRGFKYYRRRGMARIYQVKEEDLQFVPARKFWGRGTVPVPLRAGDFLVTGYPDSSEIYLSRHAEEVFQPVLPEELVRSQEEMIEYFLPKIFERGVHVSRSGEILARQAKVGELIRTLIDGELIAEQLAELGSMVVRQESADRELQVISASTFEREHELPALDLEDGGPEVDALRIRGYKRYKRLGTALLYKVTEEDTEDFMPGGRFQVPFSSEPMPLRPGDYLEARWPDPKVLWTCRNALQIYATGFANLAETSTCSRTSTPTESWAEKSRPPLPPKGPRKFRDATALAMTPGQPLPFDRASSVPAPPRLEADTPNPGGMTPGRHDFVNKLRNEVSHASGMRRYSSDYQDPELRVSKALEEALKAAATNQVSRAARWYRPEEVGPPGADNAEGKGAGASEAAKDSSEHGAVTDGDNTPSTRSGAGVDFRRLNTAAAAAAFRELQEGPPQETEAEAAVAAWMQALPAGARALLVLLEGGEYMSQEAPRQLLTRMLRKHPGLHLLVTLSNEESLPPQSEQPKAQEQPPPPLPSALALLPSLSPQVSELGRPVSLPPLSDREAAEAFVSVLLSRQQGRALGGLSRQEALPRLEQHEVISKCKGQLCKVIGAAEAAASSPTPLLGPIGPPSTPEVAAVRSDAKASNADNAET
eukprot:TRINITY_DN48514_c0_g1_i1.p1 TRINITY_DN48514_c0_g1~~TRINITY_DN48514_c0_g1_i1.p1  ORF type:complete len:1799 (-),score=442.55 TRINITY_DN48514_c0_g1_i1:199-5595(-)